MIKLSLSQVFNLAIFIPAILGLLKVRRIDRVFVPFIILLCFGAFNEVLSIFTAKYFKNNAVNNNIYVLIETILILVFMHRLELFKEKRNYLIGVMLALAGFWIVENLFISSLLRFNSYYRVSYSFVIVLFSVHLVNKIIVNERRSLIKNPAFLILMGFIIFFTIKLLVEIFWIYGLNGSRAFRVQIYRIVNYINLFVNILDAIAILCIPKKQRSTLLLS